jgi:hypothetical protein
MPMPREYLPFCDCGWLERAARDPTCPIEFDPELNEYHLKKANGYSLIYHCPFCAGRAPKSLRAKMFATVSSEETIRLHQLTKNLKTEKQVLKHLGVPTKVLDPGVMCAGPDKGDKPGEIRACKSLRYDNHSDTATINVNVGRHVNVSISFSGKGVGKPNKA